MKLKIKIITSPDRLINNNLALSFMTLFLQIITIKIFLFSTKMFECKNYNIKQKGKKGYNF